jgi:pimeloyl-ACP methyl ester carboxylesterase
MATRGLPRTFELSVRVPGSGGDVAPAVIDPNNALKNSGSRHILLLVHGYNNSHDEAQESYGKFIDKLRAQLGGSRDAPDAIAKFHWPGDESTFFGSTAGYAFDINHARDAAQRLATYLTGLPIPGTASLRITIVGHSMGCRLILEALGRMPNAQGISLVGLMAAASPVEFVKRGGRLFRTGNPPRRMLKFFSEEDNVLQFGFPLGQWHAYQMQIEDDNYSEAVGRHGHPDEFGREIQTRNGHSDYWPDKKDGIDGTIVATLVREIDATIPAPIAVAAVPARTLPPASELASRSLLTRGLPG